MSQKGNFEGLGDSGGTWGTIDASRDSWGRRVDDGPSGSCLYCQLGSGRLWKQVVGFLKAAGITKGS
jgi:hypothetical protein